MKKLLNSITTLALGAFTTIYFLTLFIKSYNKDSWDGYEYDGVYYNGGTDITLNTNYLTFAIIGLIILIVGAYTLWLAAKNSEIEGVNTTGMIVGGCVSTLFPLGLMFKMVTYWVQDGHAKYLKKVNSGEYYSIHIYILWAFLGAVVLAYGLIRYFTAKKNK